jgi:hypothetical protein
MTNKGGRPPKNEDERAVKIWVYVAPAEREKLRKRRKDDGISISQIIRQALRDAGFFKDDKT